jgi:hypothetical protein
MGIVYAVEREGSLPGIGGIITAGDEDGLMIDDQTRASRLSG